GSVVHDLLRRSGPISVHVISAEAGEPTAPRSVTARVPPRPFSLWPYLGSALAVGVALGVGELIGNLAGVQSIALVFLMAVLGAAIAWGLLPALSACLVSVLAYNFFFLPPLYTFTIADPENVVALFFFAVVAIIASNLAARVRNQAVVARDRTRITEELYLFSRKLAGTATLDDLLWATVHQIALMLKVRVVVLLPEDGGLVIKAGFPPEDVLDEA